MRTFAHVNISYLSFDHSSNHKPEIDMSAFESGV
jgi:hypothetical protein